MDLVEQGLADAPPLKQWAMNRVMCETAIRYEAFTGRGIEIGRAAGRLQGAEGAQGLHLGLRAGMDRGGHPAAQAEKITEAVLKRKIA